MFNRKERFWQTTSLLIILSLLFSACQADAREITPPTATSDGLLTVAFLVTACENIDDKNGCGENDVFIKGLPIIEGVFTNSDGQAEISANVIGNEVKFPFEIIPILPSSITGLQYPLCLEQIDIRGPEEYGPDGKIKIDLQYSECNPDQPSPKVPSIET